MISVASEANLKVSGGGLDLDNQKKGGDGYVHVFMYKFAKM